MKRFILMLLMTAFGANAYGFMDPGPRYKYNPIWIPQEEGTPTSRIMSSKALKLKERFKEKFPEYTLSYDAYGVLKEIKAPANVALSTNPLTTGTYTLDHLFNEFSDFFGIGTECLQPLGGYKGFPVFSAGHPLRDFVKANHTPDASRCYGAESTGYKGTWSLTINYPYQIKDLDLTPAITGTQAAEIVRKDLFDWFNWPDPRYKAEFPSKKEYIDRYLPYLGGDRKSLEENDRKKEYIDDWYNSDKREYEQKKELYTTEKISPEPDPGTTLSFEDFLKLRVPDFSEWTEQQKESKLAYIHRNYEQYAGKKVLGILIHNDLKPYLVWEVTVFYPHPWIYYIDAKRGKVLYGSLGHVYF